MPTFRQGDMWSVFDEVDYFIITTNSTIKKNGAVVMGAGIAKQVRDRYYGIDVEIGQEIKKRCGHMGTYGVILGRKIGVFQVKHFWGDAAKLWLIQHSTAMLKDKAEKHPSHTFALNFPGIGNGGLAYNEVLPIVAMLPDNVQVWTRS